MLRTLKLLIAWSALSLVSQSPLHGESIKIPVMVGQSGASISFGTEETHAYQMAADEWNERGGINGQKIELEFEDTQTKQSTIVTAFHKIARNRPPVILGPTWLDGYRAIIPLAERKDIALVTPSAAVESFGQYTGWPITFYYNTTIEIEELLSALHSRGLKKVALIYETEPYAEMVRRLMKDAGVELTVDLGVQGGESDFRPILGKVRASKPEVLMVLVWNQRSLLSLFQQRKALSINTKVATVHDGESWLKRPELAPLIKEIIYPKFLVSDASFVKEYTERVGEKPILTGSNAYDAANAVFSALEAGAKTGTTVRQFLLGHSLNTKTFGPIRLNKAGAVTATRVEVIEHRS